MANFEIAPGRRIGGDNPCFIIAEVGQNHQGDIRIAKEMIKMAYDCGADCVKFQKCNLDSKFNKQALARSYDSEHSWGKTYGEHKSFLEFSEGQFIELQQYAKDVGILFSSSAGDSSSIDFLDDIGLPFLKIASPDCGNLSFVQYAASKGKPLIISTGMQNMETVRTIYESIKVCNQKFSILHCTSTYPTPPEDAHLRVMQTFKTEFPEVPIGYSSHEQGCAISIAAVAMGAKLLERHVTLNKNWKGNDHTASLEPNEFKDLIKAIRTVEKAFGTTEKRVRKSEEKFIAKLSKSLVATRKLSAGQTITESDVVGKVAEPKGIPVEEMKDILGSSLLIDVQKDQSISWQHISSNEHLMTKSNLDRS